MNPDIGTPVPEPIPDPVDAFDAARTMLQGGQYAAAVGFIAWVLARLAYAAADKWPTNVVVRTLHLGHEKVRAALIISIAGLGALVAELAKTEGANWKVVAGAILGAAIVFFRTEPKGAPARIATPPPPPAPTVPAQ